MGLAQRIHDEFEATPPSGCTVGRIRATLPDEDREALDYAVRQIRATSGTGGRNQYSTMTAAHLFRALRAEGHPVGKDGVQAHAYGRCSCER
jgi:hypothetical protein